MSNDISEFAYNNLFGTMSQAAEIQLVAPLLHLDFFKDITVQRRLAVYPFENNHNKSELICEIMDRIWPSKNGNRLFPIYKSFEHYLTASGKRGHFLHQFEVFLLGLNILLKLWTKSNNNKKMFKVNNINELIQVWLLTSTTHDLGYPLQVASDIMDQLSRLYKDLELVNLSAKYNSIKFENEVLNESELKGFVVKSDDDIISYYVSIDKLMYNAIKDSTTLTNEEISNLIDSFIKDKRHGFVSSKILCRTIASELLSSNPRVLSRTNRRLLKLLHMAMAATALHDMPKSCNKYIKNISFEKNPYAYLLFIIDNIQDWSRGIVPDARFPEYNLRDVKINDNHLSIDYQLSHENWTDALIKSAEDDIKSRKKILKLLVPLSTTLEYNIFVRFFRNDSSRFSSTIKLTL